MAYTTLLSTDAAVATARALSVGIAGFSYGAVHVSQEADWPPTHWMAGGPSEVMPEGYLATISAVPGVEVHVMTTQAVRQLRDLRPAINPEDI